MQAVCCRVTGEVDVYRDVSPSRRGDGISHSGFPSPAALPIEDTTDIRVRNLHTVQSVSSLGDQLKAVLTPEIGFPADYIEPWGAAIDIAFAPGLIKTDVRNALENGLSEDMRRAALAFYSSTLGKEAFEITSSALELKKGDAHLAEARSYLKSLSAEQNELFEELFAMQADPKTANKVMDIYFRAMKIAAEPIVGVKAADDWIAGSDGLRNGYVEDYFLTTVATFRQFPQPRLRELAEALKAPEMVAYAQQSTNAFHRALDAAAGRLEIAYHQALESR